MTVDRLIRDCWFAGAVPAEHWLPNALGSWREIAADLRGKRLALFLDYDGTLAAIAPTPGLAVLTAGTRAALQSAARAWPTAIVTGRALDEIEVLAGVPGLIYAGSHGFDIRGPHGLRLEVAVEGSAVLRVAAAELRRLTAQIAGTLVEEKRFSVALHYRQVAPAAWLEVAEAFGEVLQRHRDLRGTEGKRVLELRPAVAWGKGHAVLWLLRVLGLTGPDVVPIYIGDDATDEDAFRALGGRGLSIQVGRLAWSEHAQCALADVLEVRRFLQRLAAMPR